MRVLLIAVLLAAGLGAATPKTASAVSWSPWLTRWVTASYFECQKARKLAARLNGHVAFYHHAGCAIRVRTRHAYFTPDIGMGGIRPASVATFAHVQIDNSAPIWPAWGMRLDVDVAWDGNTARYDPNTLWCNEWSFVISVTEKVCQVLGQGTADMVVRMAYDASFVMQGGFFAVQRGAEEHVTSTGLGSVRKWP